MNESSNPREIPTRDTTAPTATAMAMIVSTERIGRRIMFRKLIVNKVMVQARGGNHSFLRGKQRVPQSEF
jgi:hypothetical protein